MVMTMVEWGILWNFRSIIWEGFWITIQVSALSIILSAILGIVVGCLRVLPTFYLHKTLELYVEIMRNIPAVVKLFLVHFVLGFDAFEAGVIALTFHQSAYIADVITAGLQSLPKGQLEAALSTGLSYRSAFVRILIPQAIQITIPPLTTQFVQVVKNSAIVMLISLEDLTFVTQQIEHQTFRGMEAAIAVTILYLLIALFIILTMNFIDIQIKRKFK